MEQDLDMLTTISHSHLPYYQSPIQPNTHFGDGQYGSKNQEIFFKNGKKIIGPIEKSGK